MVSDMHVIVLCITVRDGVYRVNDECDVDTVIDCSRCYRYLLVLRRSSSSSFCHRLLTYTHVLSLDKSLYIVMRSH